MKRSLWHAGLALTLVATVGACSAGNSSGADDEARPASSQSPTADLSGVELTMWVAQSTADLSRQPIEAFEKATGATVEAVVIPDPYEGNIPTKLATGDKPDLAWWQPTASTLPAIQPAVNLQVLDGEPWVEKLGPSEQGLGIIDGKRYAAIVQIPSVSGVYYNKAVFEQAGITALPQNYAELLETAAAIKAAVPDVAPFYEAGGDKWPVQWQVDAQLAPLGEPFWAQLNKNEAKWTDPRFVDAVATYKSKVIDAGLAQKDYKTGTFVDQAKAVVDGSAAMVFQVTAIVPALLADKTPEELDATLGWFPIASDGPRSQYVADATNGVVAFKTGDADREAASRQFLSFWLGPNYPDFIAENQIPSLQPDVPSPTTIPELVTAQAESLETGTGMYYLYARSAPDIHLFLNDMLYDKKSPQEVAEAMQKQFEQVAQAQGAEGF